MNIIFNGEPRTVELRTTVAELLAALPVPPRHVAVEVNLDVVPRERHGEHELNDGDRVEVVTLVGGG